MRDWVSERRVCASGWGGWLGEMYFGSEMGGEREK